MTPGPGTSRPAGPEPAGTGDGARREAGLLALEVAEALKLVPHREGGFFRETYRSATSVSTDVGPRPLCTAIVYLLAADSPSRFHRLRSDEVWFFHAGDPAELFLLDRAPGTQRGLHTEVKGPGLEQHLLGPMSPQLVVPAGRWLAARVAPGTPGAVAGRAAGGAAARGWTLVGCVATPGFEYEDFEMADRETLLQQFPGAAEIVQALT